MVLLRDTEIQGAVRDAAGLGHAKTTTRPNSPGHAGRALLIALIVILLLTSILVGCTTRELSNETDTEELVFQPCQEIQKDSSIPLEIQTVPTDSRKIGRASCRERV